MKAVSLFSGGLDSMLSVKLIQNQKIEVTAFHFLLPFNYIEKEEQIKAVKSAHELNMPIEILRGGKEYIEMLKEPKHGYGKNMNPCIDCKIFIIKKAFSFMKKIGASFLFSGEVIGQRPMSQRKKIMERIEKEAEVEGMLLRPLSAKLLPSTIPEEKGWIKRENLCDFEGRSRKPQIVLAKKLGITEYPPPAGGCLLTDIDFSIRLKDAFKHNEDTISELTLLNFGRHFRLKSGAKLIVGRDERENQTIEKLADDNDLLIEGVGFGSPIALLKNSNNSEDINISASICVRYSKKRDEKSAIVSVRTKKGEMAEKKTTPMDRKTVNSLLIHQKN
jgi:tRNA-specific 2-thiouridylase